jgi:hypothetical protein
MTEKHKEKSKQEMIIFGLCETSIHLGFCVYMRVKEKQRHTTTTTTPLPCHRESHEQLMEGQMTPTNLRPDTSGSRAHPLDPSSSPHYAWTQAGSSLVPNFGKCDRTATNADRVPRRTPLVVMESIRSLINSTIEDSDATKENVQLALSSTKSWTRVTELRRASSSVSVSHRAACYA